MTNKELMEQIMAGKPLVVVEYRSSKAENIKWRDKETQKTLTGVFLRHTVEAGEVSVAVNERTGEDFKADGYKAPFKKGEKCVLVFTDYQTVKGATSARGVLVPLS